MRRGAAGYLHALRPGRSSFALDLMEELRAPLCDRLVISMFNKDQFQAQDSVRFYRLGNSYENRIETMGKNPQEFSANFHKTESKFCGNLLSPPRGGVSRNDDKTAGIASDDESPPCGGVSRNRGSGLLAATPRGRLHAGA